MSNGSNSISAAAAAAAAAPSSSLSRSLPPSMNMNSTNKMAVSNSQVQSIKKALGRQMQKDRLSAFIVNRPTLTQLLEQNLIEDTMTWFRQVTTGTIPSPRNCHTVTHVVVPTLPVVTSAASTLSTPNPAFDNAIPFISASGALSLTASSSSPSSHVVASAPPTNALTADNPHSANAHSTPMNANTNLLYLLGGYGTGQQHLELLVLNVDSSSPVPTWYRPLVAGVLPIERYSHTCVAVGTQLVLFAGISVNGTWLNDVHIVDVQAVNALSLLHQQPLPMMMWYQPHILGTPPCPRAAHSATAIGNSVYIFAGNDGKVLFNDLHVVKMATNARGEQEMRWMALDSQGTVPAARAGHTCNYIGHNKLLVFGGGNAHGPMNDIYIIDVETLIWQRPPVYGSIPSPRAGHSACVISPTQLLVFGGGYLNDVYNDLYLFNFETMIWSKPTDTGTIPIPRAGHTSTVIGSRIYTFAGGNAEDVFNDMHVLDTSFFQSRLQPSRNDYHNQSHIHPSDRLTLGMNSANSLRYSNADGKFGEEMGGDALSNSYLNINTFDPLTIVSHFDSLIQEQTIQNNAMLSAVDNASQRVETMLFSTISHIDARAVAARRYEEEMLRWWRGVELRRQQEHDQMREEIKLIQRRVQQEMKELRETFNEFRSKSSDTLRTARMMVVRTLTMNNDYSPHTDDTQSVTSETGQSEREREQDPQPPPIIPEPPSYSPSPHSSRHPVQQQQQQPEQLSAPNAIPNPNANVANNNT